MIDLEAARKAIRDEDLDGWLFTTHHHRDELADRLLRIDRKAVNTRPWYYLIPADGEPVKILHGIEAHILDHLPGTADYYSSGAELDTLLRAAGIGRIAVQYSRNLPIISYLDHGTALRLEALGFTLVSSAGLIQRTVGLLSDAGIAAHERAAGHLYAIVTIVWKRLQEAARAGTLTTLTEGDLQQWILKEFDVRSLETDAPPIVAAGVHSADPHYSPIGKGKRLEPGEVLQLDLWAKESGGSGIYADISWVGVLSDTVPPEVERAFDAVRSARDEAVRFILDGLSMDRPVMGKEVDLAARARLTAAGYEPYLRHRTGHGIDTEPHGSGVNLDGIEFPDERLLLDGSCFSVEPGVYLPEFGLRTEINVYIRNRNAVVSGGTPQQSLLKF